MAMGADAEEFVVDDVERVVRDALKATLKESTFYADKVNLWSNQIIEHCLKGLQQQQKKFKYVVTCILQQKVGAGLHTAAAAYWDRDKDGLCKLTLDNGYVECICTVFGLALAPSPQEVYLD